MKQGKGIHMITFILLVIGGLNWLLFALIGKDIGYYLGGSTTVLPKIIYILVGLSAIYELATHKKNCKGCAPGGSSASMGGSKPPMGGGNMPPAA